MDPFAVFDPIMHEEFYFDGEHNSGIYNHFNHNPYIYVYQNPIVLLDPDGKQVKSEYLGSLSTNSSFANGMIDGLIDSIPGVASLKMVYQLTTDPVFRADFINGMKIIASDPIGFLMGVAQEKVQAFKAFFEGTATDQQMYTVGNEMSSVLLGLVAGGLLVKVLKDLKKGGGLKNKKAIKEGLDFEKDELAKSIADGKNATGRNRLVPENGKGNKKGNRTDTDQLIKNDDGTYSIIETKRSASTRESKGQKAAKDHVGENGGWFEIRNENKKFGLKPGDKILVKDRTRKNKYN